MEVKCKETAIDCLRLVCEETLRHEETLESVVPDTQPDIGSILCTCGTVLIRSKDLSEARARIDANIPVKVSYQPETGEGSCLLELNIPLSVTAEHAEIGEDCLCSVELRMVSLETKALNPRKISVRADVCVQICCYRADSISFPAAPEERGEGLCVLEKEVSLTAVSTVTEKTFVLTDEFLLAAGKPAAAQILCQKTILETEELKSVGSKIVLKGRTKSLLLYLSPEGVPAAAEFSTGFSQIIETEGLPEDAKLSSSMLLSGAYYDLTAGSDGSTIGMELHLVAQVTAYGRQTLRYLADAYSNRYVLSLSRETKTVSDLSREQQLRSTLRELVETPIPAAEILGAVAEPGCVSVQGAEVTLPVNVQIFYKCSAGLLHCVRRCFHVKLQAELGAGERLNPVCINLQELYAVPASGGIELRLPVELKAFVFAEQEISVVGEIACDEDQTIDLSCAPSLVLCTVCSEDDLWQIAKENHSTVEAIREVNDLSAENGAWQRMLLIPKVVF